MKFLNQGGPSGEKEGASHRGVSTDVGLAERWPALAEYLWEGSYEDGSLRQRSTLMLFYEDGLCKVCLNDRAQSRTLWRSAATAEAALDELEDSLQRNAVDWRRQQQPQRKR